MLEHVLLFKAIRALGIDVPVLKYEILKPAEGPARIIRLHLAWGEPVDYDANEAGEPPASPVVEVKTTKPGPSPRSSPKGGGGKAVKGDKSHGD